MTDAFFLVESLKEGIESNKLRIINGVPAKVGEFPYQVNKFCRFLLSIRHHSKNVKNLIVAINALIL